MQWSGRRSSRRKRVSFLRQQALPSRNELTRDQRLSAILHCVYELVLEATCSSMQQFVVNLLLAIKLKSHAEIFACLDRWRSCIDDRNAAANSRICKMHNGIVRFVRGGPEIARRYAQSRPAVEIGPLPPG